jgi:hypothetical protein
MSALVEKKTGLDGSRTLIQDGFCAWCRAGSIFAQDISNKSYNVKKVTKVKLPGGMLDSSTEPHCPHHVAHLLEQFRFVWIQRRRYHLHRGTDFPLLDCKLNPD